MSGWSQPRTSGDQFPATGDRSAGPGAAAHNGAGDGRAAVGDPTENPHHLLGHRIVARHLRKLGADRRARVAVDRERRLLRRGLRIRIDVVHRLCALLGAPRVARCCAQRFEILLLQSAGVHPVVDDALVDVDQERRVGHREPRRRREEAAERLHLLQLADD